MRRVVSREYKLVVARGVSAAQAAKDLGLNAPVLRRRVRDFGSTGFPGKGQMKSVDEEIGRVGIRQMMLELRKIEKNSSLSSKPLADKAAELRKDFTPSLGKKFGRAIMKSAKPHFEKRLDALRADLVIHQAKVAAEL